jgi:hypothetical protein
MEVGRTSVNMSEYKHPKENGLIYRCQDSLPQQCTTHSVHNSHPTYTNNITVNAGYQLHWCSLIELNVLCVAMKSTTSKSHSIQIDKSMTASNLYVVRQLLLSLIVGQFKKKKKNEWISVGMWATFDTTFHRGIEILTRSSIWRFSINRFMMKKIWT